ncbi:MAG: TfoX/Sxy family protein [candidate division Zixibacteria bacterium]|nr:TfoX/Sxy family protein [candidate division Zixibacteria bacterium]
MSYSDALAERIRTLLKGKRGITEKKMFGGVAFLLKGKMFCGVNKDNLMARVGPERHDEALSQPHARPMDFTGRPMTGFVFVAPGGYRSDVALDRWVQWSLEFVSQLPAKKPGVKSKRQGKKAG